MNITGVGNNGSLRPETKSAQKVLTDSFGSYLKEALTEVNETQLHADEMNVRMALKDPTIELHDLTIASQKASIALDVTLAIKDRLIEGYKEIMRMQV
ncbi:MAG: flagellar hook-basal body complex protein FliE [Firmicutes bacterium]|nr:flagellar hook-basal body complex protein FliE [Bacillota bacterium]MDD4264616.1 flagellar hook-basal body complex protein FliE [Bacillota bacterium]MDD4694483.1 flagellar hook-basal body complex protein FliE [Bacillota bacterium]